MPPCGGGQCPVRCREAARCGGFHRQPQYLAAGLRALVGRPLPSMKSPRATTTLDDLHRATPRPWLYCEKCRHSAPIACAVPVIRWGPNTSSDKLRQCARCTACGHKERDAGSIPVVLILASYRFRRTCSVLQVVSKPKAVKQIRRGDAQNPTVNRRNQKKGAAG
jgi:hypothetical protein